MRFSFYDMSQFAKSPIKVTDFSGYDQQRYWLEYEACAFTFSLVSFSFYCNLRNDVKGIN